MTKDYYLVVKTGQAEVKAVENTARESLELLTPIIELTRGRKKMVDKVETHPFDTRLERLKRAFQGMDIVMDVTSDEQLSCAEVNHMFIYENGYQNWRDFLKDLKDEDCFKSIVPALLQNFDDPDYEDNLRKEIENLCEDFDMLMYRDSIVDEYCYTDIPFILEILPQEKKLLILIDCGYTPQAMESNVSERLIARIRNFKEKIIDNRCKLAFCATSYPNNINEIGGMEYDEFRLAEVDIHSKVDAIFKDVAYGDYGCVNPIRNDTITMARGWIPRIDVPLENKVFYYRKRRQGASYTDTYKTVATRMVSDRKFPRTLSSWGINQIIDCTMTPPSAQPSHWISVRMNIHIENQIRRLQLINSGE